MPADRVSTLEMMKRFARGETLLKKTGPARTSRLGALSAGLGLSLAATTAAAQPLAPSEPAGQPPIAAPAPAAPPRLEGRTLSVETPEGVRVVPIPCAGRAIFVSADRAYVACGVDGVVVVRLAPPPAVEAVHAVPGEAVGFFEASGRVWVESRQTAAQPLDQLGRRAAPATAALAVPSPAPAPATGPVPPPPPASAAPAAPSEPIGRVVSVEAGAAVIDLGAADGLSVGSRVALEAPRTGADELDGLRELTTVGEVVAVSEHRARVRLGFGEAADEGATARRVEAEVSRRRVAPPRIVGWSVAFMVRALLSLDLEGIVVGADAALQYRGERSYFLRAETNPLAGAVGQGPETGAFAARVLGGYDHRLFALGLGFGAAHTKLEAFGAGADDRRVRPTIEQHVRIGALDGLNVYATNSFARGDGGFGWTQVLAGMQIPAGSRTWLIFQGGGGLTRYQWGEVALRHMARGNGDRGSLFITAAAGGAALEPPLPDLVSFTYAGPHIGAGLEWRL